MKELNSYPNRLARSFVMYSSEVAGVLLNLYRLDAFVKPHLYKNDNPGVHVQMNIPSSGIIPRKSTEKIK